MSGQDCNTQSVAGVYTNTVVVQRHSVVMTKADKIYKVRCTYDTTSRNITFGMMPIRDPDMISITSAPEAPAPRIRILDTRGSEVTTSVLTASSPAPCPAPSRRHSTDLSSRWVTTQVISAVSPATRVKA